MLTRQHRQEGLARAYIQAVAARCGFSCAYRDFDYGIDLTIREVIDRRGRLIESGLGIDVQAKSSTLAYAENGDLVHDLEARSYNDLCHGRIGSPRILILMVLPEEEVQWTTLTEETLVLRRCAYWLSLRGATPSNNVRSVRVRIPRSQIFSLEALGDLMNRVRHGEWL